MKIVAKNEITKRYGFFCRCLCLISGLLFLLMASHAFYPMSLLAQHVSEDADISFDLLTQLALSQIIFGILLVLIGLAWPIALIYRLYTLASHTNNKQFALFIFLLVLSITLCVQYTAFNNMPHVTDATSHYFQAQIFQTGKLTAPLPPCYPAFSQHNVIMNPSNLWHTKYFPGTALYLSLFMRAGMTWLAFPLATAMCALCFFYITLKLYTTHIAKVAGLLFSLSPLVWLLGASFMSHILALMFALLAITMFIKSLSFRNAAKWMTLFIAGIAAGIAVITRPHDAVIILFFMGLLVLTSQLFKQSKHKFKYLLISGCASIIPISFLLYWNNTVYGSFFTTGYKFSNPTSLTPIINEAYGLSTVFTLQRAFQQYVWTLLRFNKVLFGWPTSLLFIPFAFLQKKQDHRNIICLAAILTMMAIYFFYPYYGFEYEARYYLSCLPFAILLTARGLKNILYILTHFFQRESAVHASVYILVLAFFLHSFCYYGPLYLWPIYSKDYEYSTASVKQCVEQASITNSIVMIPSDGLMGFRYSSGFIYNDPWLSNSVIYARDLPSQHACLKESFPHRTLYRFVPNRDWSDGQIVRITNSASF